MSVVTTQEFTDSLKGLSSATYDVSTHFSWLVNDLPEGFLQEHVRYLRLILISESPNQSFDAMPRLRKVGVGFSRGYLVFGVIDQTVDDSQYLTLTLSREASLDCRDSEN